MMMNMATTTWAERRTKRAAMPQLNMMKITELEMWRENTRGNTLAPLEETPWNRDSISLGGRDRGAITPTRRDPRAQPTIMMKTDQLVSNMSMN